MKRVLITIIMLLCITAEMLVAQTRVQIATGNSGITAATSFTVSLDNTPVSGNTLIAVISTRSTTAGSVSAITQSGAAWVRADYSRGTDGITTEIWYTTSLSVAGNTITIDQSAARSAAVIAEYSGLIYGTPLDVTANNSATDGISAVTGTTTLTTQTNELWIGAIALRSSGYTLSNVSNSFITVASSASTSSTATNNAKAYLLERMVTAADTAYSGGTISSGSFWSGAIATFKVADITGFSPASACSGNAATVTITGQGFMRGAIVYFNGRAASTRYVNSSQLTATVPSQATSGYLTIVNNGTTLTAKKPFLIKPAVMPEATVTNTTCPSSADGSILPSNIPVAVNFDYTSSQYTDLGSKWLNNLAAFTIEGWINTTTYSRNSFWGQNNVVEMGLTSDGRIELRSESLNTGVITPSAYTDDGQWHHIAGTGNGSEMKIYIDGELVASAAHPVTSNYGSSASNTMIGGYVWDATVPNYLNGQVLKTGFWDRALTDSEIIALASAPHQYTAGESGLIAGYNFFEGNGTSLSKIPAGTSGTLMGSTAPVWTGLFTYSWTKQDDAFTATTKDITSVSEGIYNLTATFNGCSTATADFVVGSNSYESSPAGSVNGTSPVCAGTQVTLTVSGGALGTNAAWKWYTGGCGTTLVGTGPSVNVTPASTTTYYVRAEGDCNVTDCVMYTVVVNTAGTWLGTTGPDWNTAENWCGGVPVSSTDVTIPSGTRYQPVIGAGGGVCNALTINSGATLTINGTGTLAVNGNWQNNGSFVANTGTVVFDGNTTVSGSSQTIFYNVTVNAGKNLSAHASAMDVHGNWLNNGNFVHNNGTVQFTGTMQQQISGNTIFNNLTIANSAGVIARSDFEVDGVLNLASPAPNETNGTLEMTNDYGDYSNVLTPTDSLTTRTTRSWDILDSHILYMGENATTTGDGEVTGKVKRVSLAENVEYSFGQRFNTISFNKNTTGILPGGIMFVLTRGADRGIHSNKTDAVERLVQIIRTGGSAPATFALKLHYQDAALNGNAKSDLVIWDHHIPNSDINTPHEHGKTSENTTDNWVELSGHDIGYLVNEEVPGGVSKYWMISNTSLNENKWLGTADGHNTQWNEPANWTKGSVPTCSDRVVIPVAAYPPTLPAGTLADPAASAFSVETEAGAILNGGTGGLLTICGGVASDGGKGSWINNGTFNPGTSTVTFGYTRAANAETATIAGTSGFFNLTVASGTYLVMQENASVSIANNLTQAGTIDALTYHNTIEYNGDNTQAVVKPAAGGGYNNLILSGNGTKTLAASELTLSGDLTLNSDFSSAQNTLVLNGPNVQNITGTSLSALNNLTINNPSGISLDKNLTVDGELTLTSGVITTNSYVLTLSCNGSVTTYSSASYISGKLARQYCSESSLIFPVGKNGVYRPLLIGRTSGNLSETTVMAEQFESLIAGGQPAHVTVFADRYWFVDQTSGSENYKLTLDAAGFTGSGTVKIVRGDGTPDGGLSLIPTTTPDYTTSTSVSVPGYFTLASECVPVDIIGQPRDTVVSPVSNTAYFRVLHPGESLTYKWQYSLNNGNSWNDIADGAEFSGATADTLFVSNLPGSFNNSMFRVILTNSCGAGSVSQTALLTVLSLPQGSLTAQSGICKGETGYLTWTSTAGTGPFTLIINNGTGDVTYPGVESAVPFSVGAIDGNTTFTVISVTGSNLTRTSDFTGASALISVKPYVTWNGAADADWQNAANWCGGVPTAGDNVLIPASAANQPVISSGDGFVHSIIVESGASVTVTNSGSAFSVSGNLTNSGTIDLGKGSLVVAETSVIENNGMIQTGNTSAEPLPASATYGNGGSIRFNATDAQQTLAAGTYNNIYINNSQGVVLPADAVVKANGNLEIGSGAALEIGAGRSVTVKKLVNNAGRSGIVIRSNADTPAGTLIFENTENDAVNASIEMYTRSSWDLSQALNSKYKWQFIGVPVQSLPALPSFSGGYVRRYNEAGNGSGYAETNRWIQLQASGSLESVEGYEIVMQTPRILQFSGQLYNGDIHKVLTYTAGADYPGQHIIGNPYTAAIDIRKIQMGENMDSTIYIYNTGTFNNWNEYKGNSSPDGTTAGQYTAIPQNIAGLGLIPGQIPAMQAFLVKTKPNLNGTINITYNTVKQTNNTIQRAKAKSDPWMRINLVGATMDNDVMWLFVHQGTSMGYDNGWDGIKMGGDAGTARIQSVYDSRNYQINTVPDINNVLISVRAGANDTQYVLKIAGEGLGAEYGAVYLLDMETNVLTDITQNGSTYYFSMTNTSSVVRFKVITSAGSATLSHTAQAGLSAAADGSSLIIRNNTGCGGQLTVTTLQGTRLLRIPYSTEPVSVHKLPLPAGAYICQLENKNHQTVKTKFIIR